MKIVSPKIYTYEALTKDVTALCQQYSFLQCISIGHSVMNKELYCINWGVGPKRILLNGAHHGMEWITALLLMTLTEDFAYHYANGTTIGTVNFSLLYNQITLSICPMINPDGVTLATIGLPPELPPMTQTKLKSYNSESTYFSKWQANLHGVDLNHNYNASFEKGVFTQHQLGIYGPGPTRYSGVHPESEPESRSLADYTRSFLPHIAVAYHSQGEVIYDDFDRLASPQAHQMAENLADISGYQVDKTEGMASYSGYKDWVIKAFGIPAFTIEVGLGENPLPLSQFEKIYEDNLKMLLYLVRA